MFFPGRITDKSSYKVAVKIFHSKILKWHDTFFHDSPALNFVKILSEVFGLIAYWQTQVLRVWMHLKIKYILLKIDSELTVLWALHKPAAILPCLNMKA